MLDVVVHTLILQTGFKGKKPTIIGKKEDDKCSQSAVS